MSPNTSINKDFQQIHKDSSNQIKNWQGCLVVFDFDGTLTTSKYRSSWQSVHEYFGTWKTHGEIALNRFLEGKITYKEFCEADAYPWINRSEEEFQRALSSIELREGVEEVIEFFKKNDCKLAIISMGLSDIVRRTAQEYKFDYWIANDLIRKNNLLTGEVVINVSMNQKGSILSSIREMFNIPTNRTIAVGDASADIDMFSAAHLSFAIDPSSDRVAKRANFVCKTQNLAEIITYFK
ncbi:MAG: HAD family hydrolase [Candidatus Hodarchaeales archaeon]|jgi:HAD superfamily PSPase-like hydrolase